MKKLFLILFCSFMFCNMHIHAQKRVFPKDTVFYNYTPKDIQQLDSCNEIKKWFQRDMQKGDLFLFIFNNILHQDTFPSDGRFEDKYGVHYVHFTTNCFPITYDVCALNYNFLVFKHLDKTFGKSWKREIRRDVVGFKSWKKK